MNQPYNPTALIAALKLNPFTLSSLIAHRVDNLVWQAVQRIKASPFPVKGTYCGHSGGKDSVLVRFLTDQALGTDVLTVHSPKPTGVENAVHPKTQEFLYNLNRPVLYCPLSAHRSPDLNLVTQIDGTRASEHDRTNGRAVDLVIDGKQVSREHMPLYLENGLFGINFVYPIYDWTDEEVWAAIIKNELPVSDEYLE